jgi:serine/threonine protein kinase
VNTLDQVAIKQMNIEDNYEEDLISEIGMMKTLKHPNIVRYLASFLVGSGQIWVCRPALPPFALCCFVLLVSWCRL